MACRYSVALPVYSELVKNIRAVDWDKVAEEVSPKAGGRENIRESKTSANLVFTRVACAKYGQQDSSAM